MAIRHLRPEDISASDAARVLAFLNAVATSEDIAAAVEFPGELDIGVRIGARILARREQLGGFTSLEQVYVVPYVGPERFTELVTSLSGARPPQTFDTEPDRALLTQIAQRLDALEAQLQPTPTIRLRALNPDVWLGQETVLLAQVQDGQGKPLVDRSLTLITTWGRLRGRAGVRAVSGNSVTVRSDHLGLCKFHLGAALGEGLDSVQQASLLSALSLLGVGTDSPRDSLPQLTELARRYRAAGNTALRRAIDVYFKRYGSPEAADAPMDSLGSWAHISVTVLAYLTPDPEALSAHPSTTLLTVRQRNWFYPWTWVYRQLLERETSLLASLGDVSGDNRSSSGILTDLLGRIGSFMQAQDGWVGQLVGQSFAEASLNSFVQTGLAKFPEKERTALLTGVTAGAKSLSGGGKLFSAIKTSRVDLITKIDTGIAAVDTSTQVVQLNERLAQVEKTKVDAAQFEALNLQVMELGKQNTTINNNLASVDTRLNGVDTNIAALDLRLRGGPR